MACKTEDNNFKQQWRWNKIFACKKYMYLVKIIKWYIKIKTLIMIEELKRMHKIRMIKFHDEKNKKEIHKLVKIPDFPYRVLKIDGAG